MSGLLYVRRNCWATPLNSTSGFLGLSRTNSKLMNGLPTYAMTMRTDENVARYEHLVSPVVERT